MDAGRGLILVSIVIVWMLAAAMACTGNSGERAIGEQLLVPPSEPPAAKAQLLVTSVDVDSVSMQSPTFR